MQYSQRSSPNRLIPKNATTIPPEISGAVPIMHRAAQSGSDGFHITQSAVCHPPSGWVRGKAPGAHASTGEPSGNGSVREAGHPGKNSIEKIPSAMVGRRVSSSSTVGFHGAASAEQRGVAPASAGATPIHQVNKNGPGASGQTPLFRAFAPLRLHNGDKISWFQAGAAHQGPIDIGHGEELSRVLGVYRATILDAYRLSNLVSEHTLEGWADDIRQHRVGALC